jgi:hypothetical protein
VRIALAAAVGGALRQRVLVTNGGLYLDSRRNMARTSRTGAPGSNVDSLDNIDLDDMFAAGGDDLFDDLDGLDLGLGNMDDIANNAASPQATQSPAAAPEGTNKRRKTKRKTTAPAFFDDLEDDSPEEPPKKKKKGSNNKTPTAATTKRGRTKKAADEGKKGPKGVMPPPMERISATGPGVMMTASGVAAAGQFGGRQKKVGSNKAAGATAVRKGVTASTGPKGRQMLPLMNRVGATPSTGATAAAVAATPPPTSPTRPHPGLAQSYFCGLRPSKSNFYPFLRTLPSEVALKNRKVYALLDRAHSSFITSFGTSKTANSDETAREDEPIFKLLQEAFREEKNATAHKTVAERTHTIGSAIGASRRTVSLFDKAKLAQDLGAVCSLLRRQHDFVKQNNANMKHWCRAQFDDEDFYTVYDGGKPPSKVAPEPAVKESILAAIKGPDFKVKVICTGFKEPNRTLLGTLPSFVDPLAKKPPTTKSSKKKKDDTTSRGNATTTTASTAPSTPINLPYSRQTPVRRRKMVGDMLFKVAQALEARHAQKKEDGRQSIFLQEKRRRDTAEDTSVTVIHTGGMWKYLQETGYFEDPISDTNLLDRLNSIRTHYVVPKAEVKDAEPPSKEKEVPKESFTDRLIGLLVEEGDSSGDDLDEDAESDTDSDSDSVSLELGMPTALLDLSALSSNEQALIQLRMIGLASDEMLQQISPLPPHEEPTQKMRSNSTLSLAANGFSHATALVTTTTAPLPPPSPPEENIDDLIAAMKTDLEDTNTWIDRRADWIQNVARSRLETPAGATRRSKSEASSNARGASLMKRNKEAKAKAAKAKQDGGDLKLPW